MEFERQKFLQKNAEHDCPNGGEGQGEGVMNHGRRFSRLREPAAREERLTLPRALQAS